MKLSGWVWLASGIVISVVSGYVYWNVPKNSEPNMAMALFFFIGIIFIIVGIMKLFFKRANEKSLIDSVQPNDQTSGNSQSIVNEFHSENNQQTAQQRIIPEQKITQPMQTAPQNQHHLEHTNTYAHIHQYKGPVHTQQAPHADAGTAHSTAHHTAAAQQPIHRIENSEHSVKCRKCGNVNHANSNYCHQCGNRLR